MGVIKDLIERIKLFFAGNNRGRHADEGIFSEDMPPSAIRIKEVHNAEQPPQFSVQDPVPQIVIKRVNQHVPATSERDTAELASIDLGHGVTMLHQRKPRRCPICATRDMIVENNGDGGKWKCEACGSTF